MTKYVLFLLMNIVTMLASGQKIVESFNLSTKKLKQTEVVQLDGGSKAIIFYESGKVTFSILNEKDAFVKSFELTSKLLYNDYIAAILRKEKVISLLIVRGQDGPLALIEADVASGTTTIREVSLGKIKKFNYVGSLTYQAEFLIVGVLKNSSNIVIIKTSDFESFESSNYEIDDTFITEKFSVPFHSLIDRDPILMISPGKTISIYKNRISRTKLTLIDDQLHITSDWHKKKTVLHSIDLSQQKGNKSEYSMGNENQRKPGYSNSYLKGENLYQVAAIRDTLILSVNNIVDKSRVKRIFFSTREGIQHIYSYGSRDTYKANDILLNAVMGGRVEIDKRSYELDTISLPGFLSEMTKSSIALRLEEAGKYTSLIVETHNLEDIASLYGFGHTKNLRLYMDEQFNLVPNVNSTNKIDPVIKDHNLASLNRSNIKNSVKKKTKGSVYFRIINSYMFGVFKTPNEYTIINLLD